MRNLKYRYSPNCISLVRAMDFDNVHFLYYIFQKGQRWRTNGASKPLGLSVLLDPMTHDNIKSKSVCRYNFVYFELKL